VNKKQRRLKTSKHSIFFGDTKHGNKTKDHECHSIGHLLVSIPYDDDIDINRNIFYFLFKKKKIKQKKKEICNIIIIIIIKTMNNYKQN